MGLTDKAVKNAEESKKEFITEKDKEHSRTNMIEYFRLSLFVERFRIFPQNKNSNK